ncbi:Metal-dependent hydrolase YbeY, involved in rRNA and/or ribosome maturation and assembly [hydrothermal vent metagenome]|uniref:Metal-dependent hydrolase YbeY, involved in rRNA and/or ribosome maturation and assembly n=1 Tax=hydrothermal vent metagenome TaxID=652676 RepID=A0A3B1E8X2_9ZZZZ
MKFNFDNQTTYPINVEFLEQILSYSTRKDVELVICHDDYIKKLNYQFRNKNEPTDVLSFPLENMPNGITEVPLGSIVICADFVDNKSKKLNHTFDEEIALLFIHGLLHLLGFDHEIDNGEHRSKEESLIKVFNLPKSLIVREME